MPPESARAGHPDGADTHGRFHGWLAAALGPQDARFAGALFLALALAVAAASQACGPRHEAYPTSDYALLELCVRLAAEGSQRLGPEARFHFQHPGPSFFYAAAPIYEMLGRSPAALATAALLWNLIALIVLVRGAARLAPRSGPFAAALLTMALLATRGLGWLQSYWNANLPVLPLAVVLLASARLATAEGRALPILVLFGSLAVQSHIVWAVPVTLASLAGLVLCVWPALRGRLGVPTRGRGLTARPLLAAVAIAAVLWALPLFDELTGDYHNLRRVITNGGPPRANPWPAALAAAAESLLGFAGVVHTAGTEVSRPRLAFAVALVAALACTGWRAARRRAATAALALVCAAGVLAVILTARGAPGALRFAYVLNWASVVGLCAGIVVLTELLEMAPHLRARAVGWPGRGALTLCAVLLLGAQLQGLHAQAAAARDPASERVEQTVLTVRRRLATLQPRAGDDRPPARFLLRVGSGADRDAALGMILALDKAGLCFAVQPFGPYRLDGRLKPRGDEVGELRIGEPEADGATVPLASGAGLDVTWQPGLTPRTRPSPSR